MQPYTASLPSKELLSQQAHWLAPARAVLLRRAGIAHHHAVLDLGAGRGSVTGELVRRSSGIVYALDHSLAALYEIETTPSLIRIAGSAQCLPLTGACLDLVFSQFALLWIGDLAECLQEIWRVVRPGGHFCAIEPDYCALIEHPPATAVAPIWLAALGRAGAAADVGRRLPGLLERHGFEVKVRLLDELQAPSPLRFTMLRELPLTPDEAARVSAAEAAASSLPGWQQLSHLPLFLIHAIRPE
jgi:SAM-dependent methyltransferase